MDNAILEAEANHVPKLMNVTMQAASEAMAKPKPKRSPFDHPQCYGFDCERGEVILMNSSYMGSGAYVADDDYGTLLEAYHELEHERDEIKDHLRQMQELLSEDT